MMDIQINYDYRKEDLEAFPLKALAEFVLKQQEIPFNAEVSISFVTDETIAKLNERFRNKPEPTDVLAFECDDDANVLTDALGVEATVFMLGDVVIAPDVAERQTLEYDTTLEQEISLLLVHGLLHLNGYDHIDDEDAKVMEGLETKLLEAWAQVKETLDK